MGAWDAFRHLGIEFDVVTGTSVGALNGALMVQGDFDRAYDMWYNLRPEQVIHGNAKAIEKLATLEFSFEDLEPMARYAASVFTAGGLDVSPLKRLMQEMLDEDRVRKSSMGFGMVTVSLTDFKPRELFVEEIPQGQLGDYLLASANLPVFKLSRLEGKLYIDGGFYDNLPINLIARKGVRRVVAVELQSMGIRQPVRDEGIGITWISPSEDIGRLLEFNPEKIRRNMKLGYFDTLRVFQGLQGNSYYLEGSVAPGWAFSQLLRLTEQDLAPIRNWMGAEEMDHQRFLFEILMPALGALLDTPAAEDYDGLLLRFYEAVAKIKGIERLQVMPFTTFIQTVGRTDGPAPAAPGTLVESVARHLRQSPMYLKTRREEFLPWVFHHFMQGFGSPLI